MLDFLTPDVITLDLEGPDLRSAIVRLTDLLFDAQPAAGLDRRPFLDRVLAREAEAPTALGEGLAVPHGEWHEAGRILGALGISREGLSEVGPDGVPVRCVVLIATSSDRRGDHLLALAAVAGRLGADGARRERLYRATSSADAHAVLLGPG